jgi:hypothetical protein
MRLVAALLVNGLDEGALIAACSLVIALDEQAAERQQEAAA